MKQKNDEKTNQDKRIICFDSIKEKLALMLKVNSWDAKAGVHISTLSHQTLIAIGSLIFGAHVCF